MMRSPLMAYVYSAALLAVLFLLFQQVGGWPIARKFELPTPKSEAVETWRFPAGYTSSAWDDAHVEVTRDGMEVPRYRTPEALGVGRAEGYVVKGREILLKGSREVSAREKWVVRRPWSMKGKRLFVLLAGVIAGGLLLARAGNPLVLKKFASDRAWWSKAGLGWFIPSIAVCTFITAVAFRRLGFSFPSWANDTGSYLESFLAVMRGEAPIATPDRPFAYPIVVGTVLRLFGDFQAIVTLHSIATLVAATAAGAIVWMAGDKLFPGSIGLRVCSRLLGIFAFSCIALNERIAQREWALLAEAWVAFYLGVQALLAWWLATSRRGLLQNVCIYAALCACGLLSFFTKTNWGFALAALPIPWLAATCLNARTRWDAVRWLGAGAAVLLVLAAAGFWYQAKCNRYHGLANVHDRSRALIAWHVHLVRPEIDRRLREAPDDPAAPILREIAEACDAAIAREDHGADGAYPSFGYDPDALFYTGLTKGPLIRGITIDQRTALFSDLFFSALRRDPGTYLRKVLTQMGNLFRNPYQRPTIAWNRVKLALERSEYAADNQPLLSMNMAQKYAAQIQQAKAQFARPWPSFDRLAFSERAVVVCDFMIAIFVWCLVLPLSVLIFAVAWPRWRRAISWRGLAAPLGVATWAAASMMLNSLSSAAMQGLDVLRYIELSMPLTVLAQVLWPLIGLSLLLALTPWRKLVSEPSVV